MESSLGNKLILENLSDKDIEILKNSNVEENKKNIYIFFSFDLVNSTKFKTQVRTKQEWPYVINRFYELIIHELKKRIPQISVWKYLGDEILLYSALSELDCVYSIPENVYITQKNVTNDLKSAFESLKEIHLDIKSTVWIAGATELPKSPFYKKVVLKTEESYSNIKISLPVQSNLIVDFIGPDMDIGFRIAKYAYHHKVTLSSDFAYLLLRMKKPKGKRSIEGNIKIVSFEALKGVWNESYYPIIWYYPEWKSIDKDFYYADHKNSGIVENVLLGNVWSLNELERVYEELGKTGYIEEFIDNCISLFMTKEKETAVLNI